MERRRGGFGLIGIVLCLLGARTGSCAEKAHDAGKGESSAVTTRETKATSESEYVYKTVEGRDLTIVAHWPEGWKEGDKRTAMVFWFGGGFYPFSQLPEPKDTLEKWPPGPAQLPLYFAKRGLVTLRAEVRGRVSIPVTPHRAIEDAISAMRWIRQNAGMLGIDPDRIVTNGRSGGSILAASVFCIEEFQAPDEDRSISHEPNAMILYAPGLDLLPEGSASELQMYAYGGDREYAARISPGRHWRANMPPTLILISSNDPNYAAATQLVATWKPRGEPIDIFVAEGAVHGFQNWSPWLEKTTLRTDEFLQSIGFLSSEPKVDPPAATMPESERNRQAQLLQHGVNPEQMRKLMEARKKASGPEASSE